MANGKSGSSIGKAKKAGQGKGSKAKGRNPKFNSGKFSQESLGTPF